MIHNPTLFESYLPAGFDGQFHWDFLRPAWGTTRIEPTDVDAMVERYGAFLLFETKEPGVPIPEGQRRAFEQLLRLPQFTIIHCAKDPRQINEFEIWTRGKRTHVSGDAETLVDYCRSWREYQEERREGRR